MLSQAQETSERQKNPAQRCSHLRGPGPGSEVFGRTVKFYSEWDRNTQQGFTWFCQMTSLQFYNNILSPNFPLLMKQNNAKHKSKIKTPSKLVDRVLGFFFVCFFKKCYGFFFSLLTSCYMLTSLLEIFVISFLLWSPSVAFMSINELEGWQAVATSTVSPQGAHCTESSFMWTWGIWNLWSFGFRTWLEVYLCTHLGERVYYAKNPSEQSGDVYPLQAQSFKVRWGMLETPT